MVKVESKEDLDIQLRDNKNLLAIFYSTWCPYCNRFLPAFNKNIKGKGFEAVVEVILDDDDNPLWEEYSVSAVPTILYFEDAKVVNRLDARLGLGLTESMFEKWLQEFKKP